MEPRVRLKKKNPPSAVTLDHKISRPSLNSRSYRGSSRYTELQTEYPDNDSSASIMELFLLNCKAHKQPLNINALLGQTRISKTFNSWICEMYFLNHVKYIREHFEGKQLCLFVNALSQWVKLSKGNSPLESTCFQSLLGGICRHNYYFCFKSCTRFTKILDSQYFAFNLADIDGVIHIYIQPLNLPLTSLYII